MRQPADTMRQREAARRDGETTRGRRVERRCNNQPARREDKWTAQQEDEERRCGNKLARREDERR
jgi:hypothetical protein